MEQRETAESSLAELRARRDALAVEIAGLQVERDAAFAEIDAALAERRAERSNVAGGIPAELLPATRAAIASRGVVAVAAE